MAKYPRGGALLFFVLCVFFTFHLFTLSFPMWTYDDGCLVDFALNGRIATWEKITPAFSGLAHSYGIWDSWIWQVPLVRFGLTHFGVGYWSLRLFPFLIHFAALVSLIIFLKKTRVSDWAIYGLIYYLAGTYFFTVSHSGRPEPAILALMVLNLFWFYYFKARPMAFAVGALTGLGAGFHVNIAYIAAAVPFLVLINGEPWGNKVRQVLYWALGFAWGLTIFAYLIPGVDHIVYFFQFQESIVSTSKIPLLSHPFSVGPILLRTFVGLNTRFSIFTHFFSFFQSPLIALEIFSVIFLFRRFSSLIMPEKAVVIYSIIFFCCYSWLEPHIQAKYFTLIHPWFFISVFLVLDKVIRRSTRADFFDLATLIVCHAVSFWAFFLKNKYVFTHIPDYLLRYYSYFSAFSAQVLWVGGLLSVIGGLYFGWMGWRFIWNMVNRFGYLPVYFSLILFLFLSKETYDLARSFKPGQLSPVYRQQLKDFVAERNLVAPNFFFVLEPALSLQCPFALKQAGKSFPGFDSVAAVINYRPTAVFWPEQFPSIPDWLSKRKSKITVDEGPFWETPLGNFRIYRLHYPDARQAVAGS